MVRCGDQIHRPCLIERSQVNIERLHLAADSVEALGVVRHGGRTIVLALQILVKLLRIRAKGIADCRRGAGGGWCGWSHVECSFC